MVSAVVSNGISRSPYFDESYRTQDFAGATVQSARFHPYHLPYGYTVSANRRSLSMNRNLDLCAQFLKLGMMSGANIPDKSGDYPPPPVS